MHIPVRRRAGIESAQIYEYPEHLRQALQDLPAAPGVYLFHADDSEVPLYIGKSVNLRARVLAHLRNRDEARMLRQAVRISHIRTAGEIGALLQEARLIKQLQPLYNKKLRRNRQLYALRLHAGVPQVVHSRDMNFATEPDLFGLFASRHAALEALHDLADMHMLCYGALGLERLARGRPCFRHMLRKCAGVCCGAESQQQHDDRLSAALEALRVATWPYSGAIGLVEQCGDMRQVHAIRNWCYLGSADSIAAARKLDVVATGFDADGYRILCAPLLGGRARILPL